MKCIKKASFVLVALAVAVAAETSAQGVEPIMNARETLGLTADQIQWLDGIRRELVAQRSAEQAEMAELRSRLAAGQIRRSEVLAAQEDRQAAAEGRVEERRARIDAVLTEEQRAQVEQLRTRAERARDRGQGIGRGGPGFGRGAGRGAGPGRARPGAFRQGGVGRGDFGRGGRAGFWPR